MIVAEEGSPILDFVAGLSAGGVTAAVIALLVVYFIVTGGKGKR